MANKTIHELDALASPDGSEEIAVDDGVNQKRVTLTQVANFTGAINLPASSTDNAIVRWGGTDGDALRDSGVLIDDNDLIINETGGLVIGKITTTFLLDVVGSAAQTATLFNVGTASGTDATQSGGYLSIAAIQPKVAISGNSNGTFGTYYYLAIDAGAGTTLGRAVALNVEIMAKSGTGTITDAIGLYVSNQTIGASNYAAYFNGYTYFNSSIGLKDGVTAPAATSGQAKIYVDSADGDLKIKFGDGTVKTIVTDT